MGGLLHLVQRGGAWAGYGPAQSPVVIVTSAKAEVMRSGRFDCHSVCLCAASRKKLCVNLHDFFITVGIGPVSGLFHFGGDPD